MTDICPLCQSRELSSLNSISTAVLGDLYLKGLGIDIAFEAKSLHYFLCNACGLGFFSFRDGLICAVNMSSSVYGVRV
jgi:hypothetical protein